MRLLRFLGRRARRQPPEPHPTLVNVQPVTAAQHDAAQDYPTARYSRAQLAAFTEEYTTDA
ncbi:hypothetical protein [Nocardia salmonicida]|uniref:hypothetical protein n=1 Tax=Nocardia salmonicida TaxID=53431 RepID=UPI003642302D